MLIIRLQLAQGRGRGVLKRQAGGVVDSIGVQEEREGESKSESERARVREGESAQEREREREGEKESVHKR